MTSSKIQMIRFFMFLLIFLLGQVVVCDKNFSINRTIPDSTSADKSVDGAAKIFNAHVPSDGRRNQQDIILSGSKVPDGNKTVENVTSNQVHVDKPPQTIETRKEHVGDEHATLNVGALKRGFYVFVGLSVLVMAYIMFRSFRLSKTRAQMVRKYGVLAHRQDVEMRPLPLDEDDDEDTTVFDASNIVANNVQHQDL